MTTRPIRTRSSPARCVRSVAVPGLDRPAALITLDNGFDHTKPNTLRPGRPGQPRRGDHRGAGARAGVRRDHRQAVHLLRRRRHHRHAADHRRASRRWSSAGFGHRVFARLRDSAVPDVRVRQRRGHGRRPRGGAALPLPHAVRRGQRARAARGVARPGAGLGRHPAAAQPDRHRPGRPGDHPEPADAEDAASRRRPASWASPTRCSSRPTSWSGRWSGRPAWSAARSTVERPEIDRDMWDGVLYFAKMQLDERLHGAVPSAYKALELLALAKDGVVRRRHRGRGRGARRPGHGRGAAQQPVRVRPGAAPGQAAGRRARRRRWPATSPRSASSAPA